MLPDPLLSCMCIQLMDAAPFKSTGFCALFENDLLKYTGFDNNDIKIALLVPNQTLPFNSRIPTAYWYVDGVLTNKNAIY